MLFDPISLTASTRSATVRGRAAPGGDLGDEVPHVAELVRGEGQLRRCGARARAGAAAGTRRGHRAAGGRCRSGPARSPSQPGVGRLHPRGAPGRRSGYGHSTVIGSPTTATLSAMSSRAQWFPPQPGRPSTCWPTTVTSARRGADPAAQPRPPRRDGERRDAVHHGGVGELNPLGRVAQRPGGPRHAWSSSSTATTGAPSSSDGNMRGPSRSASSSSAEYRTASCSAPARSMAVLTSSRHSCHPGGLPPRSPSAPPISGTAARAAR